jgi:hypothetical protein
MIPLTRKRVAAIIPPKYRGQPKKDTDFQILKAWRDFLHDNSLKVSFNSSFWKDAKDQLKLESNGKCAYCEANTQVVAHGDVEHYRPKSVYWWLSYTYDNYVYACQICNQVYKGDSFPVLGAIVFPEPAISGVFTDTELLLLAGRISPDPIDTTINFTLAQYETAHHQERPALINPYLDDPTLYIAYEADDTTKEVKVVAKDIAYQPYIDAAEKYYGINRVELRSSRYTIFKVFRVLKQSYAQNLPLDTKTDIADTLNEMKSDKYIFAGMNRYFDEKGV